MACAWCTLSLSPLLVVVVPSMSFLFLWLHAYLEYSILSALKASTIWGSCTCQIQVLYSLFFFLCCVLYYYYYPHAPSHSSIHSAAHFQAAIRRAEYCLWRVALYIFLAPLFFMAMCLFVKNRRREA